MPLSEWRAVDPGRPFSGFSLDLIYARAGRIREVCWSPGARALSGRKWNAIRARPGEAGELVAEEGDSSNRRAALKLISAGTSSRARAESGAKGGRRQTENASQTPKYRDLGEAELKRETRRRKGESLTMRLLGLGPVTGKSGKMLLPRAGIGAGRPAAAIGELGVRAVASIRKSQAHYGEEADGSPGGADNG